MFEGSELFGGNLCSVRDISEQESVGSARLLSWFRSRVPADVILVLSSIMFVL